MTNTQLTEEIRRLKRETDTVLLAHTYQRPEILDIADLTGDSLRPRKSGAEPCTQARAAVRRPLYG